MLATWIVVRFEQALTARRRMALFIPGLDGLADAVGTQTEAAAVRGLSLSRVGSGPAYGSGPLATIALDLLSRLIYFGSGMAGLLHGGVRRRAAVTAP